MSWSRPTSGADRVPASAASPVTCRRGSRQHDARGRRRARSRLRVACRGAAVPCPPCGRPALGAWPGWSLSRWRLRAGRKSGPEPAEEPAQACQDPGRARTRQTDCSSSSAGTRAHAAKTASRPLTPPAGTSGTTKRVADFGEQERGCSLNSDADHTMWSTSRRQPHTAAVRYWNGPFGRACRRSADRFDLREAGPIADTAVSHAGSALCGASSVVSSVRVPAGPAGEPRGGRRCNSWP